ncbi:MAG: helix-turn-helix transcriptional regulator [Oscillospiraceae bacterium]|nr:helix-turn-helix transcriptional regulator [Oscillospiraceae bacterium]
MENLKKIRKARGLTLKKLGEMTDVSESMIQMVESGARSPSFELLLKLGEALDCSVDELIDIKREPDSSDNEPDSDRYNMSDKDLRFVKWFRSLPQEKQKAILISQDAPEDLL